MSVADRTTDLVHAHFARSRQRTAAFFEAEAPAIAEACERLAAAFARGGTLFVLGSGAQASDAQHVAVEFVHPVIVGKRALPAIALTSDSCVLSAAASAGAPHMFATALESLAGPDDILLALCTDALDAPVVCAFRTARARGLLTLLLSDAPTAPAIGADLAFCAAGGDPLVVQEIHETLYHVLWELVHVFLEHHDGAPASARPASAAASEHERALYPFLFDDAAPAMLERARQEVRRSVLAKSEETCALRQVVADGLADRIARAGTGIAARTGRGGRLLAFGNGGSATDAQDVVADCMTAPVQGWRRVPALALTNDVGVLTAIANDVGFEHVYARQVLAFARPDDIALGISTSGASRSIIAGLEAAKARGLLTLALSGRDGGALARSPAVDVCLTVPSDYTPRIQEVHATIWHAMLSVAQAGGPA